MRYGWKLLIAAGFLGAGIVVLAAGPFDNPKVVKEIGLTPQQVQKLDDLQYAHQKEMIDLRRDVQIKMLDLRQEMQKDDPNPKVIDRLIDEGGQLRAKVQKARLHHILDVKAILTPEQWQKARTMLCDRLGRQRGMDRGKGRGMKRGQGRGQGRGMGPGNGPGGGPGMNSNMAPDPEEGGPIPE
jgi:Spy/CpxP family protein refolding chaperone